MILCPSCGNVHLEGQCMMWGGLSTVQVYGASIPTDQPLDQRQGIATSPFVLCPKCGRYCYGTCAFCPQRVVSSEYWEYGHAKYTNQAEARAMRRAVPGYGKIKHVVRYKK